MKKEIVYEPTNKEYYFGENSKFFKSAKKTLEKAGLLDKKGNLIKEEKESR